MRLSEPTTTLTDYLLALLAAGLALSLVRRARAARRRLPVLWLLGFGAAAIGAAAGGSFHGFRPQLAPGARAALWRVTISAILASAALFTGASILSIKRPAIQAPDARARGKRWILRAVAVSLAGLAIQKGRLGLHEHFNHNDLYHVIQALGLVCLYRGARVLEGLEAPASRPGSVRKSP